MAFDFFFKILLRFVYLTYYIYYTLKKYIQLILNQNNPKLKLNEQNLKHLKTLPRHIAFVFDSEHKSITKQCVIEYIRLVSTMKEIAEITVYFPKETLITQKEVNEVASVDHITVYNRSDVDATFAKLINDDGLMADFMHPFRHKVELLLLFSNKCSLCGFFPWTNDFSTLYFGCSGLGSCELHLMKALWQFSNTTQNMGR